MARPRSGGRRITIWLMPRHVEALARLDRNPRAAIRGVLDQLAEPQADPPPAADGYDALCESCAKVGLPSCPSCIRAYFDGPSPSPPGPAGDVGSYFGDTP